MIVDEADACMPLGGLFADSRPESEIAVASYLGPCRRRRSTIAAFSLEGKRRGKMKNLKSRAVWFAMFLLVASHTSAGEGVTVVRDRCYMAGFKRSSQHLEQGDCGGHTKAAITPVWTRSVALTGATAGSGTN
jgi:hypothetical protein